MHRCVGGSGLCWLVLGLFRVASASTYVANVYHNCTMSGKFVLVCSYSEHHVVYFLLIILIAIATTIEGQTHTVHCTKWLAFRSPSKGYSKLLGVWYTWYNKMD